MRTKKSFSLWRATFERTVRSICKDIPEDYFKWDAKEKKYLNPAAHYMWLGFCLVDSVKSEVGHFVIAAAGPDGRSTFSKTPYVHRTYDLAKTELDRLADSNPGLKYIMYHSVTSKRVPKQD